jgi:YD repeat-containing protein
VSGPVPLPVVSYELDAVGRPTKETRNADVKTFGWDGAGRLRRVGMRPLAGAPFDMTYGYDHAGLRIWKEGPGGRSTWLWGAGEWGHAD